MTIRRLDALALTVRARIAYRGWTADGLLRQASFKGVREEWMS
jgi:hypothetical protein